MKKNLVVSFPKLTTRVNDYQQEINNSVDGEK